MRELRPPGSVRGVRRNAHPYRDRNSDYLIEASRRHGHFLAGRPSSPCAIEACRRFTEIRCFGTLFSAGG